MRKVRSWLGLGAISATLLSAAPARSEVGCCSRIKTKFGETFVAQADSELAERLGNHISRRAHEVLRLSNVRFKIVEAAGSQYRWAETSLDGLAVYPWRFVRRTDYVVASEPPNAILPHEVGHDLLNRYLIPNTRVGQYGTDSPDWLDESVAISFEVPEELVQRRCETSSLLRAGKLIPLAKFLSMEHPSLLLAQKAPNNGESIMYRSTISEEAPAFYAMSLAFYEYLVERTGSQSILTDVIRAFRAGKKVEVWLTARLRVSNGLMSVNGIERDFRAWLRSSEKYACMRAA